MKVAGNFGYLSGKDVNNNSQLIFSSGNKDDMLIIGGSASVGNRPNNRQWHKVYLKDGNDVMIVGAADPELKVGILQDGDDLGRIVAGINSSFDSGVKEISLNEGGYYTKDYGHLSYFEELNLGAGNDALVVRDDVYNVTIRLESGNDDVFIGKTFYNAANLYAGSGKDHVEIMRVGSGAKIYTEADDDIVTVHGFTDDVSGIELDLGQGNDTLILATEGVKPDMANKIKGGEGVDTIIMNIDGAHANSNHGLRSSDFEGFERIIIQREGLLQIRASDLFNDTQMETIGGKHVLRVENNSGATTTVNLGEVQFQDGHLITPSFTDRDGGEWRNTRTEEYDDKQYTVYSYSHNGIEAEVWFHGGNFSIV